MMVFGHPRQTCGNVARSAYRLEGTCVEQLNGLRLFYAAGTASKLW